MIDEIRHERDESDRVRAAIMKLLKITGHGPDPLVTAMWATGLHRAVVGPDACP